jgi:23S rRNA (adenine2030-N6)-methyltransferase
MNYRHAFHAGNHADVLKHLALVLILERLAQKPAPFAVIDTHAGAGLYDLASDEARPEWQAGAGRVWDWADAPAPIARYRAALGAFNADALTHYPGSPLLAAQAMRVQDRLVLCELHPEEAAKLRAAMARADGPNVQIHQRDGFEAVAALTPPAERRGLVLIDPPYEATGELAVAARAIKAAQSRFAHGVYLWWRPLKDAATLDAADAELSGEKLRADFWTSSPARTGPLTASSVLVINPPYGLKEALFEALPALAARLSPAAGARVL